MSEEFEINNTAISDKLTKIADLFEDAWNEDDDKLDEDKVENIRCKILELSCEITEHEYGFDQCGYWQHKFCYKCNKSLYPDLRIRSCGELSNSMKNITENNYILEVIKTEKGK